MVEEFQEKIIELRTAAKENLEKGLKDTPYENEVDSILKDYLEFLKVGISFGLINLDNINMYEIKEAKYIENGNAYASWVMGNLTIQPRFFIERNSEERRNVLFHELIHSLMEKLINYNVYADNFTNLCLNMSDYLDQKDIDSILEKFDDIMPLSIYEKKHPSSLASLSKIFINEATTQSLAEILTSISLNKSREGYKKVESKLFTEDTILQSNFATYPEYQQIFLSFLRTINGLGTIENDDKLFLEYFTRLENGTIWQQIVGTYSEKNKMPELFETLMTLTFLKNAKESSMGINVSFSGDKNKMTKLINDLITKLNQSRNLDEPKNYPYVEYAEPEPIVISIKPRK